MMIPTKNQLLQQGRPPAERSMLGDAVIVVVAVVDLVAMMLEQKRRSAGRHEL